MTITDGLLITVTLLGPVLAVQSQKWIERATARRDAKRRIFYALMGTRATRVAPEHVQALNMIDLEFSGSGSRDRQVLKEWREYADHLNTNVDGATEAQMTTWLMRGDDLFIDLLEALAHAVGYRFDKVQLRKGIYYPRAHDEAEREKIMLNRALFGVLSGETPLSMRVTEFPAVDPASIDDDPTPKKDNGKRQRASHS